jgi:hypothetical protein
MPDKNIQNILKDFLLLFYFIFKHKCKIQIDHLDISDSDSKITAKEKTGNLNNEDILHQKENSQVVAILKF